MASTVTSLSTIRDLLFRSLFAMTPRGTSIMLDVDYAYDCIMISSLHGREVLLTRMEIDGNRDYTTLAYNRIVEIMNRSSVKYVPYGG